MAVEAKIASPFFLEGMITEEWALRFVDYLYDCAANGETAFAVVCGTGGGNLVSLTNVAETLRITNVKLITVGFGCISNLATAFFCLGDERVLMEGAELGFQDFNENANKFYLEKTNISPELFEEKVFGKVTWLVPFEEAKGMKITTDEYADVIEYLVSAYSNRGMNFAEPFFFSGEVNPSSTKRLLEYLYLCAANEKEAFVEFCSGGGSGQCMDAIISTIELTKVRVTTIGGERVASAAAALFLIGDRRALKAGTELLLHEGRLTDVKNREYFLHDIENQRDSLSFGNEKYAEYCGRKTKITKEEFYKRTKRGRDWILSEDEVNMFGVTTHSYEEILKEILAMRRSA